MPLLRPDRPALSAQQFSISECWGCEQQSFSLALNRLLCSSCLSLRTHSAGLRTHSAGLSGPQSQDLLCAAASYMLTIVY